MHMSIKSNVQSFQRQLNDIQKRQLPFATVGRHDKLPP